MHEDSFSGRWTWRTHCMFGSTNSQARAKTNLACSPTWTTVRWGLNVHSLFIPYLITKNYIKHRYFLYNIAMSQNNSDKHSLFPCTFHGKRQTLVAMVGATTMGTGSTGLERRWYSGLALGYASLGTQVRIPVIRWPLFILWYHRRDQRLPKLLPYYPQMVLTMLYASEAIVAISLTRSQHIQERM